MAYRSDQPAVVAALAETRELAEVARQTLWRRRRAKAIVGALFASTAALPLMVARAAKPAPRYACHHVEVQYEQVGGGVAPPPQSWTACEWTPPAP